MHSPSSSSETRTDTTLGFFVLTLSFTWLTQAPALLAKFRLVEGAPEQYLGLVGIGMFGPMLVASLLTWRESGRVGLQRLYGQLWQWRAGLGWYAGALLGPPILMAAGVFLVDPQGDRSYFYPPDVAPRFVALLLVPFVEEIGWRGYALPRLLRRYSPLTASLIVGACWAAWHVVMLILQDLTRMQFMLDTLLLLAGSVVYTWLYLRSGGGLSIAIAVHAGAHLSNSNSVLPADQLPLIVQTVQWCLMALTLVIVERNLLRPVVSVARGDGQSNVVATG